MRVCILGAGAIGGFLGARLARAGHEVSVLARGATLAAIAANGLTLRQGGASFTVRPRASDDPARLGPVEAVLVAVKGPALPGVGDAIGPLLGPETPVVFAMNGIPWWYAHARPDLPGAAAGLLDPTGSLRANAGPERAIGCVVDCPNRVEAPGVVACNTDGPGRFTLGEPDGSRSPRLAALAALLESGGMEVPATGDIRRAIWAKLVVNLSRSPLSVLAGVSELELARDATVSAIARDMVRESAAVAAAHGIDLELDWEVLLSPRHRYEHRPSMLQDWDAGRAMEIDSIGVIVSRFAAAAGLATPTIDRVLALLATKARAAGLYAAPPA